MLSLGMLQVADDGEQLLLSPQGGHDGLLIARLDIGVGDVISDVASEIVKLLRKRVRKCLGGHSGHPTLHKQVSRQRGIVPDPKEFRAVSSPCIGPGNDSVVMQNHSSGVQVVSGGNNRNQTGIIPP